MTWKNKREGVITRLKGVGFWLSFEVVFMMIAQTFKQDISYRAFVLFFAIVLMLTFLISGLLIWGFDRKPQRQFKNYLPESSPTIILVLVCCLFLGCLVTAVSLLFDTFLATFIGAFLFAVMLTGYVLLPTWHGFF